ncbi:hypothetical protein [Streptomyces sp. NPDC001536]|uniref:hypothetical protein n=1 Tax=Streptomyces sp. NPDC001536 TaxID=3364583 RepID=UPI0036C55A27
MAETTTPDHADQSEGSGGEEPQSGPAVRARTWLVAAVVAGLAAGIGVIAQDAVTSTWDSAKNSLFPPDSGEAPLTAKATMVDPMDVCEGGGGIVYLKPPTVSAAEQEFNKQFKNPTGLLADKSTFDAAHEARAANYGIINLLLQGTGEKAVTISKVSIKPVAVQPAPKALRIRPVGGCGDANMSRFSVDLDSPQPRLKFKDGRTDEGKQRVSDFPYQVSQSDTETVVIVPVTNRSDYRFKIAVDWESGDQSGTLEVGDGKRDGEPFEIVSGVASAKYTLGQEMVGDEDVRLKLSPFEEAPIIDPFEYIDSQTEN